MMYYSLVFKIISAQEYVVCLYGCCRGAFINMQDAYQHYSEHLKDIENPADRRCPFPGCAFPPKKKSTFKRAKQYANHIIYKHHSIGYACPNGCRVKPLSKKSSIGIHLLVCVSCPRCCQSFDDKRALVDHIPNCTSTAWKGSKKFSSLSMEKDEVMASEGSSKRKRRKFCYM